jgi:hypothetical protein
MKKIIFIGLLLFISLNLFSNEKFNNSKINFSFDNNIVNNQNDLFNEYQNGFISDNIYKLPIQKYGASFVNGIFQFAFWTVFIIGMLGCLSMTIGIPLLAYGIYNYNENPNEVNRNFIISGSVTLGVGFIFCIPLIATGIFIAKNGSNLDY